MKSARDWAIEMRRSASEFEKDSLTMSEELRNEIARNNRAIADRLEEGQGAIDRLAVAEALLRGLTAKVLRPDLSTNHDGARQLQWARKNVQPFLAGDAVEPLEGGKA